jgi:hypothetical protein
MARYWPSRSTGTDFRARADRVFGIAGHELPSRLTETRRRPAKCAAQELIHGRPEFVGRSINSNSESFQRLQARDAGGVVEIEASETCEPAQRLQTRDARGVVEVEPVKVCQPLQRLQARNSDGVAQIERAELRQSFQRLQARDASGVAQIERAELRQSFQRRHN